MRLKLKCQRAKNLRKYAKSVTAQIIRSKGRFPETFSSRFCYQKYTSNIFCFTAFFKNFQYAWKHVDEFRNISLRYFS